MSGRLKLKLFSQTEKSFYLFKDERFENGITCHTFDFIPGSLVSDLFPCIRLALIWLAKTDSSIKFIKLDNEVYCFIRTRHKTYAAIFDKNFSSIISSLVYTSQKATVDDDCEWLNFFAENEGEIFFVIDSGIIMVDFWVKGKRGCFKYTTVDKFIELVEKFVHEVNN